MSQAFRPTFLALSVLASFASVAHSAVTTYSGVQGAKANLISDADVTPPVLTGTDNGTDRPGTALGKFEAAITPLGRIGFEPGETGYGSASFDSGTIVDGNAVGTDFNLGRYNMTGYKIDAPGGLPDIGDQPNFGRWLEAQSNFTISFSTAIGALGFFGTDFTDFGGSVVLKLFDSNGLEIASNGPLSPAIGDGSVNGGLIFYGLTSTTAIKSVTFEITQVSSTSIDLLGFDEFVFGNLRQIEPPPPNPAPEPGTLALAGLSLLGLAAARRRRRG